MKESGLTAALLRKDDLAMQKICISKDWLLKAPGANEYKTIDLPNDYTISLPRSAHVPGGPSNGYFPGGDGRYVKYLTPESEPQHVILDLDGAYMCAEIALNEDLLAMHPHGYTPFLVDLTDKMRFGRTNKLSITTHGLQCSTRWYSGAGIYRDVFLWTGGSVRVEPRDVFVSTLKADEKSATIKAAYQISSDIDAEARLTAALLNAEGALVASAEGLCPVSAQGKAPLELMLTIHEPKLWSPDSPNLYTLKTAVYVGDQLTDEAETIVGIRTIEADAEHGFRLNGKMLKMRGGCIHHDHGVLGAAAFPAAEERKLSLLKKAGFNAVRIAHNPPSLALLEVCDRIGLLVMDEAFDMWRNQKNAIDYHLWFEDWWARDIAAMVLRDRNHPCVVSYSIGNEIIERNGNSDGAAWSARLSAEIRKYDATRLVTSGVCGMWTRPEDIDPDDYKADFYQGHPDVGEGGVETSWPQWTQDYMAPLDIVGYNYLYERYELDHKLYPQRVIWGSETHAVHFYDSWQSVLRNDHVLGDFTWTAYDNLGEAGTGRALWARDGVITGISLADYPWRSCYQGDLDLCGYRRPQSYFREAVWLGHTEPRLFTTHPEHYGEGFTGTGWHWYDVLDSWTFDDAYLGKPVKTEVYTDADEIAFLLNGREIGRARPEKAVATLDIPYEKGELTAIAYKSGVECGRSSLQTVGAPSAIRVTPESERFTADRRDLCYFEITITDAEGRRVPYAQNELNALVDGGELLGIFSGDPKNEDQYTSCRCHAFEGRALAIVRTHAPGQVTLSVGGANLRVGSACAQAVCAD